MGPMTPKERTQIVQEISRIIDRNPGMSSFQLANIVTKEVVEPCLEITEAVWQRLLFNSGRGDDIPH